MIDLKAQKPAKRYGEAIFEVVKDKDHNEILGQIKQILNYIENNQEFSSFIFHPIVPKEDKKSAIKEIFFGFDCEVLNFIFLLIDENRLDCLDEIEGILINKFNKKNNLKLTTVTLAIEPEEELKNTIKTRLENKFQANLALNFVKCEDIIGGMIVQIDDTVIDMSIKNKIENLKRI